MTDSTENIEEVNLSSIRARMSDREWRQEYSKLDFVNLAPQQWKALNSPYRFTLIQAGNQSGKTFVGGVSMALRCLRRTLEGSAAYRMPPGRTDGPFGQVIWCLSSTNTMTRDGVMTRLLGDIANGGIGRGLIPGDRILGFTKAHGLVGLVDTAFIKADDGSTTALRFKSLDQSREALQTETVSAIWVDELPTGSDAESQWNELVARTTVGSGSILLTATPKRQQSPVMRWFKTASPDRGVIRMSTRHTNHLSAEAVKAMETAYSPLERATRLEGDEFQGGGLVLRANKELCGTDRRMDSFNEYHLRIVGFDPHHGGLSENANPSAMVYGIWISADDVLWIMGGWKQKHISPEQTVARVKQTSFANAPVAWGRAERSGTGGDTSEAYHQMYGRLGMKMLPTYATLPGGSLSLDITFDAIQHAMLRGQLKISNDFYELWDEINSLERDEHNKIIETNDDLLAALRYAFLDRKKARVSPQYDRGAFDDIAGSSMRVIQPNRPPEWGE